ncbi:MAG: gamma-glutamyl-gamma-aminobutyrate hydrolase family protein [Planctomycetota bacterium]|nr:gamma-glutamyl-gamma-aminobutyrate hydrolase family protein [Planctomycetota bacterium]
MAARPRIGINADYRREERERSLLASAYYDAVSAGGGIPLILPPLADGDAISGLLDSVDGVVLTGGGDYDPAWFGAEPDGATRRMHPRRERFDLRLVRQVVARKIPTLGICAGAQLLAIASGGDLDLDIPDHEERAGRPVYHEVEIEKGSRMERAVGARRIRVNSQHHQAIRRPGEGFRVVARSADGVAEGIEASGHFLLGVQWHPELLAGSDVHERLFEALVRASGKE